MRLGVPPETPPPMKSHYRRRRDKPHRQRKFEYEPPPEEKELSLEEPQGLFEELEPTPAAGELSLGTQMCELIRSRLPIEVPLYREGRPQKPTGVTVIMKEDAIKPGHGLMNACFPDKIINLDGTAQFRFYVLYSVEGSL